MAELTFDDDLIATVAACTALGNVRSGSSLPGPLTTLEWNQLARWLHQHGHRPAQILDRRFMTELAAEAAIPPQLLAKLESIPQRATSAAMQIEALEHRGIWALARFDPRYPARWRHRLRSLAPPVVFGAGSSRLLESPSTVAIVGSRDIDASLEQVASELGALASRSGILVVTGGARGSDRSGLEGAITTGGQGVAILSHALDRLTRAADTVGPISDGLLCLISHVHPRAGFSVGQAMARNKYIYGLADATIIIATAAGSGGTWSGATENVRHGWSPMLIWTGDGAPAANETLVAQGAKPFAIVPSEPEAFRALLETCEAQWRDRASSPDPPADGEPGSSSSTSHQLTFLPRHA